MIRRLQPWELDAALPIARAFHAESGLGSDFDASHFMAGLENWSASGSLYLCASSPDGRLSNVHGCLCGILAPHFMTGEVLANELFWFILPEHRGGKDAIRMLDDFEAWAREHGATHLIMASFARGTPETVNRLYQRRGFDPIETHHLKPLN